MITTLPAPCWRITVNPSAGSDHEDMFEAHYDSRDEALAAFPAEERAGGRPRHVVDPALPGTQARAEVGFDEFDGKALCNPCVEKAERDELRKVGG